MSFLADTFTDSDGVALPSHTGETGATWTRHPNYSADPQIKNNRAYLANSSPQVAYASGTPASADYSVFATVYVASNLSSARAGVAGRISTAANTYYSARYHQGSVGWLLYKMVGGTQTQLGSTSPQILTVGNSYQLELRLSGSTISLWVDGAQLISVTDTAISAAGKAGLYFQGGSATTGYHIDEISALDSTGGGVLRDFAAALASSSDSASDLAVNRSFAAALNNSSAMATGLAVIRGLAATSKSEADLAADLDVAATAYVTFATNLGNESAASGTMEVIRSMMVNMGGAAGLAAYLSRDLSFAAGIPSTASLSASLLGKEVLTQQVLHKLGIFSDPLLDRQIQAIVQEINRLAASIEQ